MRILVTGCKGQVGSELVRQGLAKGHEMIATDTLQLDISDRTAVEHAVALHAPDVVVNAAAYTAVDQAETESWAAFTVNHDGPANLAVSCSDSGIPLVHYSTDYVFDGSKAGAYVEDDAVAPLGVYGESKLAGETAVRQGCPQHLVLRTSWVFSAHGHNFVKTMLRLGAEREELGVVADQFGRPSSAGEIARITLEIIGQGSGCWGVYHLAQPDVVSWHGFAEAIFDEARAQGIALKVKRVNAIATSDYPTPVKRPANSALDCKKIEQTFGVAIRPWRDSLAEVIEELKHG